MSSRMNRKIFTPALAAVSALILAPASANAGVLLPAATDCADQTLSQPFIPWADTASYTLDAGGDFESTADWQLKKGAAVVDGNEPFLVGSPTDSKSLSLPAGSGATSSAICVGIEHPTIRFFARSGNPLATLDVHAQFEDVFGNVQSLQIGTVNGGGNWAPTATFPIIVNVLPLLPGQHTAVSFKFCATGGDFQIDDFYVDPYRSS
ncbi:MAG: hypothetical protein QOJ29_841 [Thermoleophilaceae bacterium]|nr:hypothetical protein [Thermoleophilaceae bacterium]